MNDEFDIIITNKGLEVPVTGKLISFVYTHRIEVNFNNLTMMLESDEESYHRALSESTPNIGCEMDLELVEAIVTKIESAFK